MALDQLQHVLVESFNANTSGDVYDTWFGVELNQTPNYSALTHTMIGGFFDLVGDNAKDVTVVESGLRTEAFVGGDPGYYVRIQQPDGCGPFKLVAVLVYTVLV